MRSLGQYFSNLVVFIAFAAVVATMVMTVGDIALRLASSLVEWVSGVRPTWGLQGLVDLTQLGIMVAVPLAIASAFVRSKHIRISLISDMLVGGWLRAVQVLSASVGICVMAICLWTAIGEYRAQLGFPTTSATLNIPYTWYWAPLATGFALSLLSCCVSLLKIFMKRAADDQSRNHV